MRLLSPLFCLLSCLLPLLSSPARAEAAGNGKSPRIKTPLVEWQFAEDTAPAGSADKMTPPISADWKKVTIPHVFRQSGLPDNTAGWYRHQFSLNAPNQGRSFYLVLDGAASVKDVFVNGRHIGQHKGAFSRSTFDLTPALKFGGKNTLDVRVSNRDEDTRNCFSRSHLYYVNGGMFRHAWLVETGAVHAFPDMGSTGLYLTPEHITPESADLNTRVLVKNSGAKPADVVVRYSVEGPSGAPACEPFQKQQLIPAGETATVETTARIANPVLWDLAKPNLYTVRMRISVNGKVTDELIERAGFRTIAWKDNRFYLNGREVQFRGVSKHAQTEESWNSISDDTLRGEWDSMIDMGVNAVRLAHYPHAPLEYDIADQRGIAVWAENGFAGQWWEKTEDNDKGITPDGERLTREMVRQNWNHPSILFWSAGNETIVETVAHYARELKKEDSTRLVTYAANGPQATDCDFVANNTYDGWYERFYNDFAKVPLNALISETGCGDWVTHHVPYGTFKWKVDKFEPEEYAGIFAEYRLQTICRNDVANRPMFFWWNFREFYNKKFKDNRNTKGLLTLAGTPKDLYYLFQSFLNPSKAVVHLCHKGFFLRSFAPDNGIKAYSNAVELTLTLNGVPQGTLKNGSYRLPDTEVKGKDGTVTPVPGVPVENVFFWKTPLQPGRNVVSISDGHGHSDSMIVYQKPSEGTWPADPGSLVQELRSSNPESPAFFIDRPVTAQSAFYSESDGSSDNTFDTLPKEVEGASWIATRRLSDPKFKTDLSFRINPSSGGATASVIFSTGDYPTVTLKPRDTAMAQAADSLRKNLKAAGFKPVNTKAVWRDHMLALANAELWSRSLKPGEALAIPGESLDYAVLLKGSK